MHTEVLRKLQQNILKTLRMKSGSRCFPASRIQGDRQLLKSLHRHLKTSKKSMHAGLALDDPWTTIFQAEIAFRIPGVPDGLFRCETCKQIPRVRPHLHSCSGVCLVPHPKERNLRRWESLASRQPQGLDGRLLAAAGRSREAQRRDEQEQNADSASHRHFQLFPGFGSTCSLRCLLCRLRLTFHTRQRGYRSNGQRFFGTLTTAVRQLTCESFRKFSKSPPHLGERLLMLGILVPNLVRVAAIEIGHFADSGLIECFRWSVCRKKKPSGKQGKNVCCIHGCLSSVLSVVDRLRRWRTRRQ